MTGDQKVKLIHEKIEKEVPYVDIKPYSHNIISLLLRQLSEEHGQWTANKAIDKFSLESMGWSKVKDVNHLNK